MDWPLSVAEKQSRAFDLYQREVVAVEASLQAAERELRKLKDDQGRSRSFKDIGLSSGKADSHRKYVAMKAEEEKPERKATFDHQEAKLWTPRRRWSRGRGCITPDPKRSPVETSEHIRAVSSDRGQAPLRERRVPLVSLEQFLGQQVPSCPFSF